MLDCHADVFAADASRRLIFRAAASAAAYVSIAAFSPASPPFDDACRHMPPLFRYAAFFLIFAFRYAITPCFDADISLVYAA